MKQDRLEDFIRQNRNAFDDREPSEGVWNRIARSLTSGQSGWWNSVGLWRAAAVIFMVLSAYLLIPRNEGRRQNEIALKEFTDIENFYTRQISEKVELIDEIQQPQGRSEGLNGFTHDFQQLEAMYLVLRDEMKIHPSQKVKDALVLNLLVRIDLLNQQLHKLESGDKPSGEEAKPQANI